jgi:hypothetical protein
VELNLEFDQPIAERTIEGSGGHKVVVTLGSPRFDDEVGGWVCPYRIDGLPGEPDYRMFGGGIDGIQAIIAALANIGAYLNYRWKAQLGLSFHGADHLGLLDALQPPLSNWSGKGKDV